MTAGWAVADRRDRGGAQKGSIAMLATVAAIGVAGIVGLAIDLVQRSLVRSDIQSSADAAAMAGSNELARIYSALGEPDLGRYTLTDSDKAAIVSAARRYGALGTHQLSIEPGDVRFGRWDVNSESVGYDDTGVNMVQVVVGRGATADTLGAVLGSLVGVDRPEAWASASATAALSPVSAVPIGATGLPLGIDRSWFDRRQLPCGSDAELRLWSAAGSGSCAAWHDFRPTPASTERLRSILAGYESETFRAPAAVAGLTAWHFRPDVDDVVLADLRTLYDARKDGRGHWKVLLPVYEASLCDLPGRRTTVVGFATVSIVRVVTEPPGEAGVDAKVQCDVLHVGQGGGVDFGTLVRATLVDG